MRLFKRKPKKCESISFVYNYLKPDEGIGIYLGVGEDKKLPGLSRRDVAYHHIEVDEIDWLIEMLQGIKEAFNVHSD